MPSPAAPAIAVIAATVAIRVLARASRVGRSNRIRGRQQRPRPQYVGVTRARPAPAPAPAPVPQPRDAVPVAAAAVRTPEDAVTYEQQVERARHLVIERQDASAAMLTREMRIGVLTVVRILADLERQGVVGPPRGGGAARTVLIDRT